MVDSNKNMRPPEAAAYLRMGASTLAKLRRYGGGPRFAKLGRRLVLYAVADLDAWLSDRLVRSTSEYSTLNRRAG